MKVYTYDEHNIKLYQEVNSEREAKEYAMKNGWFIYWTE